MVLKNIVGKSLEQRRSTLFLIAGGLFAVVATLRAAELYMDMATGEAIGFFGPVGMTFAFLGMLGLYPALVKRTPWLARAAALFTVAGIVGTVVGAVSAGGQLAGILAARPAWVNFFQLPALIGIVLGFLTFGVAVLRTDAYSRAVGLFLLGPAVMFPTVLLGLHFLDFPHVIHPIHNGADALALLAVGYLLRLKDVPTGRAEPSPDTTGG